MEINTNNCKSRGLQLMVLHKKNKIWVNKQKNYTIYVITGCIVKYKEAAVKN